MKRKDRDEDIRQRRENYTRGLAALAESCRQFAALTGVDLTGDVDIAGRHMGEAPYLKITADRLREITQQLQDDIDRTDTVLRSVVVAEVPNTVLQFSPRRPKAAKR